MVLNRNLCLAMIKQQNNYKNDNILIKLYNICNIILIINVYLSIVNSKSIVQACPARNILAPCTCHDLSKGLEITCEGIWPRDNLQKVFTNLYNNVEANSPMYLKLKDTDLSVLPSELFSQLEIRHLMAHKCSITHIERETFEYLRNRIESIDLSENNLAQVPDALQNLASLLSLNLNFNSISSLQDDAFHGLNSLVRLSLFGNKIRDIHPSAFSGPSQNLTRINLGGNRLKTIPTESLRPLRSLQRLQVHENQIETLEWNSFRDLLSSSSFDAINLAHNQLESLGEGLFIELANLSSLDFEGNRLATIHPRAFTGIENSLEWLKLGNNQLQNIPSKSLKNLNNLRELDLRDNNIQTIQNNDFRSYGKTIKFIYLQKNKISTIDEHSFEPLNSLEWLNLAGNELKTLSERTLDPILNNLLIFDISDNPLLCSCTILWLDRAASTLNGRNKAAQNNIPTMETVKCYHESVDSEQHRRATQLPIKNITKHYACSATTHTFQRHTITLFTIFLTTIMIVFV